MRIKWRYCLMLAMLLGLDANGEVAVRQLAPDTRLIEPAVRDVLKERRELVNYRRALWPGPEVTVGNPVPLETLDPNIVKEAAVAIRHVLKDDLIPDDLAKRFVAQRVRMEPRSPYIADMLMAQYELGRWRIRVQEGGHQIRMLLSPLAETPQLPPEEYVLHMARKLLKIPAELADQVFTSSMAPPSAVPPGRALNRMAVGPDRSIWYGNLRCKAREQFIGSFAPDRPTDTWVTRIATMTDGRWVFFSIRETHRPPGPPQPRPGIAPRFPQPRASSTPSARPRPSPAQRKRRRVRRGWEAYLQTTSKPAKK